MQLQKTFYIENMFRDTLHFLFLKSLSKHIFAYVSVREIYFPPKWVHKRLQDSEASSSSSSPQQQDQHTGSSVCFLLHCSLYINLKPPFTLWWGILVSMLMSRIWCLKEKEKELLKCYDTLYFFPPGDVEIHECSARPKLVIISLWITVNGRL